MKRGRGGGSCNSLIVIPTHLGLADQGALLQLWCTLCYSFSSALFFGFDRAFFCSYEQDHYYSLCWYSYPPRIKCSTTPNALNSVSMLTMHRVQCIVKIVSLWRIRSARVASLCFWWLMAARSLCGTDYQMLGTPTHRYEIWKKEKY